MVSRSSRSPPPLQEDLPIGQVVEGKYLVERLLGEGGMAYVLAARNTELDLPVAIKYLRREHRTAELISRFAREARAMARLRSDFVTRILDVGMSPTLGPFIVMERLEGHDMGTLLEREGAIDEDRAVDLTMMALCALAEAHAAGIVHRDLKPENMFIHEGSTGGTTLKLLDFGVSQMALTGTTFGTSVDLVKTSALIGSPLYMAPEQIRGIEQLDARTDIWAIGAIMYELVTGRVPFPAGSITELSARVLEDAPIPPRSLTPRLSPAVEGAILQCLSKRPEDRFQTVESLAMALQPLTRRTFALPASVRAKSMSHPAISEVRPIDTTRRTEPSQAPLSADAPHTSRPPTEVAVLADSTEVDASKPKPHRRRLSIIAAALLCVLVGLGGWRACSQSGAVATPAPKGPPSAIEGASTPEVPAATTETASATPPLSDPSGTRKPAAYAPGKWPGAQGTKHTASVGGGG